MMRVKTKTRTRTQNRARAKTKAKALMLVAFYALSMFAWGNYRWYQGMAAGADTVMCIIDGGFDGSFDGRFKNKNKAAQSESCVAIKGRKPPYFFGFTASDVAPYPHLAGKRM